MIGPDCVGHKPLKIGDIELANRVLLAPMSGVTDAPFRRLAARLGAGLVVSEMTASDDLVNGKPMVSNICFKGAGQDSQIRSPVFCWVTLIRRPS